jgi:hypothetical protein
MAPAARYALRPQALAKADPKEDRTGQSVFRDTV